MEAGPLSAIVRVTHSRDELARATEIGFEKKREGYSPEALVLAIDEVLHNLQLSRAIVLYVQSTDDDNDPAALERPFSWISVLMSAGFSAACLWLVATLFRLVRPDSTIWDVILIVIVQAILLRFVQRGVRLASMSACDGLNDASYPTNLHPLRNASSAVGTMRLRRLRALVAETAERIVAGDRPSKLRGELAEVNLTPRAAAFVVALAQARAWLRDFLPPYENRWLGYTLAIVFVVTCVLVVERAGDQIVEGYKNYAIAVTGWIAGDIAARPRRRPRSPAS